MIKVIDNIVGLTLTDPQNIKGGSWAFVYHLNLNSNCSIPAILKIYGECGKQEFTKENGLITLDAIEKTKKLLTEMNIKVPKTYFMGFEDLTTDLETLIKALNNKDFKTSTHINQKIILLEEFTGSSMRDIYRKSPNNIYTKSCINLVEKLIKQLPEGMEFDVSPGNFTFDKNDNIYFIDFMPPNFSFYTREDHINEFKFNFPTYGPIRSRTGENNMLEQYTTTQGRLYRFQRRLSKLL